MGKDCCLGFSLILAALAFLCYLIIAIFVVPITCQCQSNSTLPQNPEINLTMQNWIYGGLGSGVFIFVLIVACVKNKSDDECWIVALAVVILLYIFFVLVWSIIGMVIFYNYYNQACQNVQNYSLFMDLGIYFGFAFSAAITLPIIILLVSLCVNSCCVKREERQPLLVENQPEAQAPVQQAYGEGDVVPEAHDPYAGMMPKKIVITDSQFHRNRNIYEAIFSKMFSGYR